MADNPDNTRKGNQAQMGQRKASAFVTLLALVLHYFAASYYLVSWTPWVRVHLTLVYVLVIAFGAGWIGKVVGVTVGIW